MPAILQSGNQPEPKPGQKLGKLRPPSGEEGYIFLAVLFMVVLVMLTLSIAAPKIAKDLERDREIELMHRGKQYRRAIQLYYRKFGAYPPNLDVLEKSTNIRFLRKRYKDPVTGKDEWHLIHFGENKTPTAMGFFGQPIGGVNGSTLAGVGPGGMGQNIGTPIGQTAPTDSGSSGSTDPNAGSGSQSGTNSGSNGSSGSSGFGSSGLGGSSGSSGFGGSGSGGINLGGNTNSSGQTFGGLGVIGVESTSPKETILEYKKKHHFNEWEFVYDPAQESMSMGGGAVGQPIGSAGNSIGNPGAGGGGMSGSGGFNNGGGFNSGGGFSSGGSSFGGGTGGSSSPTGGSTTTPPNQ